ncbi:MAG TPA: acyltransferase [Chitinophagaceae bacterium]|nr:acyltransferase [Chitinophagaceae bacterium]
MYQKRQLVFYPQLDTLRGIAVLLVIISHWFSKEHFLNRYSDNGVLGVTLFFVLSGFLITGILLNTKGKLDRGGSFAEAFKVFYIRRSLRIFPVYYLLLFVVLVFNLSAIKDNFWWHFFYGSNFYFWTKGAFAGNLSHLWSLALEEQFYLVWPAIIFFIQRSFLPYALMTGIVVGIVFRFLIIAPNTQMGRFLLPGSFDSFCIGGLLVYGRQAQSSFYKIYLKYRGVIVFLSFFLLLFVHFPLIRQLQLDVYLAIYLFLISVAFGIQIDRVSDTVTVPIVSVILNNKILLYIGKISYGLYLFHNLIPYFYGVELSFLPDFLSPYFIQLLRFFLLINPSFLK